MTVRAPATLHFVCPRCKAELSESDDAYRCESCVGVFPIIEGIPDFRLFADPWISLEDDRLKARRLIELTQDLEFEDSVRAYWRITRETPSHLAERFVQHVIDAPRRTRDWLERSGTRVGGAGTTWLDLGCGTGDLAAAAPSQRIIGIDIALRWLVIARKRPELAGRPDVLVCCCAEYLPFRSESFDAVFSLGMLEHVRDENVVLREAARVLRPGGQLRLRTAGRYTLLREPHTGVRGVGFVPRRFADLYVRRRSGQRYLHHRPLSPREVRNALLRAPLSSVRVGAAPALAAEIEHSPGAVRRMMSVYERARGIPFVRSALKWIAPILEAEGNRV